MKFLKIGALRAASTTAVLCAALSVSGCGGGLDSLGLGGGGDNNNNGGGAANIPPPPSTAVKLGASGVKTAAGQVVGHGAGLFIKIPNVRKAEISDRSGATGNAGSTVYAGGSGGGLPKAAFTITDGKMAGGTDIRDSGRMGFSHYDPESGALKFRGETGTQSGFSEKAMTVFTHTKGGEGAARPSEFLQYSGYGMSYDMNGTATEVGNGDNNLVSGDVVIGSFFGGAPGTSATAKANMPANVKANYNGRFTGTGFGKGEDLGGVDGSPTDLAGDVTLQADFSSGKVRGNVYNMTTARDNRDNNEIERASFGLRMTGDIDAATGNTYKGDVAFTKAANGAWTPATADTVTSSSMIGAFYGPKAAETVGALRIEGKAPGVINDVTKKQIPIVIQGAFGAKKK